MFAVIDLETTGGSASRDKITEIAIIVHDGVRRLREFTTLVNPERPIPHYITDITGISDDMVADAPKFYEVAKQVVELTEGCTFVAHNVNFDYGFLREEFRQLGFEYQREKLCTVRTSRKLIPGLPSYSLGKLCRTLGIPLYDRHRAMGDADATTVLLEQLLAINPNLRGRPPFSRRPTKDPYAGLPPQLDRGNLDRLPSAPGLYFMHDVAGNTLFADKTTNIRRDALKNLKEFVRTDASIDASEVCEITWERTGNELLAMLRLSETVHKQDVSFVRNRRKKKYRVGVFAYRDQRDYLRLHIVKRRPGQQYIAEFPTEDDARAALEARMRKHGLCANMIGLSTAGGPCAQASSGKCHGACQGQESPDAYNQRLENALRGLGFPYPRFFLLGAGRNQDEVSVICVDDGACLGYAYLNAEESWQDPEAVLDLLHPLPAETEPARIVRQYLPKMKRKQIVPY
ncbi:MAG: exonuclease domain-containing protein [Bacteroidota bacterium]